MSTSMVDFLQIPTANCTLDDLKMGLQAAVELELSTLPPYLCGMWSIKSGTGNVYNLIRSVVIEEMLHMGLACNMLTAIGGNPTIDKSTMPTYPGGLPGGVIPGLTVSLAGLSKDQIKNIYMEIEYPENGPIDPDDASKLPRENNTIGQFYDHILAAFQALNPTFTGSNQNTDPRLSSGLFAINNLSDVAIAINTIKDQGEGTSTSPEDGEPGDELAHFYTFSEIYHGHKLVQQDGVWQFTGEAIEFPVVYPIPEIPHGGYPDAASDVREALDAFNTKFSTLLSQLQSAWGAGGKADLQQAIGTMFALKGLATAIMAFELPDGSGVYGPEFLAEAVNNMHPSNPAGSGTEASGTAPGFKKDILPLFRPLDISSMKDYGIDLSSYDSVRRKAEDIYQQLSSKEMPCDKPWPESNIELFKSWKDSGMQP